MRYLIIYSVVVTVIAGAMTYNVVRLLEVSEVTIESSCVSVEEQIRSMDKEDVNKLLIISGEVLTGHFKEETREQVEKEHQVYANRLAIEHMNDVVGVLVKSIGAMPTSTLAY